MHGNSQNLELALLLLLPSSCSLILCVSVALGLGTPLFGQPTLRVILAMKVLHGYD